jgi:hypothetical protein
MRWVLIIAIALLCLFIGGRVATPFIAEKVTDDLLSTMPGYEADVEDVDVSLLGAWSSLDGLVVRRPGAAVSEPFLAVNRVIIRPHLRSWLRGDRVVDMALEGVQVHYVLGPDEASSQTEVDAEWVRELVGRYPVTVDALSMREVEIHYHDVAASPDVHLKVELEGEGRNFANLQQRPEPLFADLELRGRVEEQGTLVSQARLDPYAVPPAFEMTSEVRGVPLTALSDATRAYGRFDAEAGTFSVTTKLKGEGGRFEGAATPEVDDVKIVRPEDLSEKKPVLEKAWEVAVGAAAQVAEAISPGKDEIELTVPIQGEFGEEPALLQLLRALPEAWFGSLTRAVGEGAEAGEELAEGAEATAEATERERGDKGKKRDRAAKKEQKEEMKKERLQ